MASRAVRVLVVTALAAAGSCLIGVTPAHADSATPAASKSNWWWSLTAPNVGGNAVPAGAPAQASGVPDGDLGVGYVADQAGTSDKVAAVDFDLSSIPLGSTFSSLVITVPYDPAAHQVANGTPDISACELIAAFADGAGPSDYATVPAISPASCVKGEFSAGFGDAGGYRFDLTAMANDWSGGAPAEGLLIEPTAGLAAAQQPFTLSFLGKNKITAQASYTPPVAAPPVVAPAPAPGPALPPASGFVSQPQMPVVQQPQPAPVPVTQVPQVDVAPTPAPQLAALPYHQGALTPGTNWWLAMLGLAALLVLTSVVLGDPMAPVPVDSRRRRFAGVVRARALTAAVTTSVATAPTSPARTPSPRTLPV